MKKIKLDEWEAKETEEIGNNRLGRVQQRE